MSNRLHIFLILSCPLLLGSCTKELVYHPDTSIEETTIGGRIEIKLSVKEPGGLMYALGDTDYRLISKLSVHGPLNGTDLKFIRFIAGADEYGNETDGSLEVLDLSGANIVEGGEPYFIYVDDEDNSETPISLQSDELSRYAFGYCKLKEIILPNSIKAFGSQAFYNCTNLETVNIPASLEKIGRSVFCYCGRLKSEIILPEGITEIPDYTFYECARLTSVTLPESAESLGYGCFSGCLEITSLGELPNLKEFKERCFENCRKLLSFIVPSTMTSIPDYAFCDCRYLTDIELSNITRFGYKSFYNCNRLTQIDICAKLEYIGHYAFYNSGLSIDIILPPSVKYMGYHAFAFTDITSVTINSDIRTYETDDAFDIFHSNPAPFSWCDKLKTVKVAEGCKILGLSFNNCSALEDVYLPNSLDSLGYYAIPPKLIYDDGEMQFYDASLDIGNIFSGCTSLRNVTLPQNLKFIARNCFKDCTSLTSIVIPDSVTSLGSSTFSGCSSLSQIILPSTLCELPYGCIKDCINLKSINLTNSINEIGADCFKNSGLQSITMPESLKEIGTNCFYGCSSLKSITIPSNVKKVEDYTFGDCSALSTVIFDSKGTLESIGSSAFYHCTSLETVQLPEGVTSVGDYCFSICGLKNISIPSTLQNIGEGCFDHCLKLTDIRNYSESPQTVKGNTLGQILQEKITLSVPSNSIYLYKEDSLWGTFPNIVGL